MKRICDIALHEFLYEHEGTELVNLKLLRGDSRDVLKEQICDQLKSAMIQKAANQANTLKDFPSSKGANSITLVELEEKL
jgi:hypothetical protein